jgi:hypothetical protein
MDLLVNVAMHGDDIKAYARAVNGSGLGELLELQEPISTHHPILREVRAVKPFALSDRVSLPRAADLAKNLKERFARLEFRVLERDGYYVYAEGPREELKQLQSFSIGAGISMQSWAKHLLQLPFATVQKEFSTSAHYIGRRLTLDEFLQLPRLALDTEYMFWEKKITLEDLANSREDLREFLYQQDEYSCWPLSHMQKPDLVQLVAEHFNRHLGTRYKKQPMTVQLCRREQESYCVDYFTHLQGHDTALTLPEKRMTIHVHKAENAAAMMQQVQEFMRTNPFVLLLTQNGMNYDALEARAFMRGEKRTAEKERREPVEEFNFMGYEPKISSICGFYKNVGASSILHVDFAPNALNAMRFTKDKKWATIGSHTLFRHIEKSETYDDLTRQSIEQYIWNALGRNVESAAMLDMLAYGAEDTRLLEEMAGHHLPIIYLKCKLYNRNPDDVCTSSKKSRAMREYRIQKAKECKQVRVSRQRISEWNSFSTAGLFDEELKNAGQGWKAQQGVFQAGLYYAAPNTLIAAKQLQRNAAVKEIFEHIRKRQIHPTQSSDQDTLARYDLMQEIEEGYLAPVLFFEKYANYGTRKDDVVSRFASLLGRFEPINKNGNFYLFSEQALDDPLFTEMTKGLMFRIACGRSVSFSRGSFVLHDGIVAYKQGIDIKGTRGFKPEYQKQLVREIIVAGCAGTAEEAISTVARAAQQIIDGTMPREGLIYRLNRVARNDIDFASPAHRREYVRAVIQFGLKKEDTFAYAKLADRWCPAEEFLNLPQSEAFSMENKEAYLEDLLGDKDDTGRKPTGKIARYLRPFVKKYATPLSEALTLIGEGREDEIFSHASQDALF